jgi:oxygen-independent coproporphyrinogen-3 oxidase
MSPDPCKENQTAGERALGLYCHVPFCGRKCRYCDFYSVRMEGGTAERFVDAALAELDRRRHELSLPLRSVYVGGGTPTALGGRLLTRLLSALRACTDEQTEYTVEANPRTVTEDIALHLADAGVNRVSVGAQSFRAEELRLLGRLHGPDDIARAGATLRWAGLENLNLDLIYGIPGQDLSGWSKTLDRALSLGPQHVSCYALSFAPGTPLEADLQAGRVAEQDDATQRQFYEAARAAAGDAGLEQYELSNFARERRRCAHNISYWENKPYVGLGPSAATYLDGVRRTHNPDVNVYVDAVLSGQEPPGTAERLTGRQRLAEALMLGLRMTQGVNRESFALRYGQDPVEAFPRTAARYARSGHLVVEPRRLRLSRRAHFVADTILADFLAET